MTKEKSDFTIETAGANEAELITVLGTTSFYEAYFEQDSPRDLSRYITESFEVGKIEAELADPDVTFFVMYRNGRAVGYAKMRRGSTAEGVTPHVSVELQRIYTIERVYGAGAGAFLLHHCLDFARREGFSKLWLGVWEENARARRFYDKHGFRRVGTLTFPYGDSVGINHVMEKELGGD